MNQDLILWPLLAQVLLVIALFIRLGQVKDRARAADAVDLGATALDNDAWPDEVRKVANNIRNQFQVPVLFFVLVLALFARGSVDIFGLVVAWLFVASRVVHSYIHIGSNYVPHRTRVFKLNLICVVVLAGLLIRALLQTPLS
jgi:hypothetical protein